MNIRAVIFTHPPDLPMAAMAGRQLQKLGVEVVLAMDENDVRAKVESLPVIRTGFARRRNLNGLDCALGIVETMQDVGEGADWVIKCDSDTLVFGLDWLRRAGTAMVGTGYKRERHLFGLCYAVRVEALDALHNRLLERGEGTPPGEDVLIGNAGHDLGILHSYKLYEPGCPTNVWRYQRPPDPAQFVRDHEIICVQRRTGAKDPDAARVEVREVMRTLVASQSNESFPS